MSTPAARPCRVIKISPSVASLRYFDRSSLTFARATALGGRAFPLEPGLRFGFGDDCEDLDRGFRNVIKHPDVANSKAILWPTQPAEPFDATLADRCRLEPEMAFESISHLASAARGKAPESRQGSRSQDDLSAHSGYMIARLLTNTRHCQHVCGLL